MSEIIVLYYYAMRVMSVLANETTDCSNGWLNNYRLSQKKLYQTNKEDSVAYCLFFIVVYVSE